MTGLNRAEWDPPAATDGSGADDEHLLVDCARSVLAREGAQDWRVTTKDFWCTVHPPGGRARTQGWKLHISATALSAPVVLARSARVLIRHRCPFKFARSADQVKQLGSRLVDRGGGGKFITAYPDGDSEQLRALAEELHRATEGLPGPGVLSDRAYRPASLVHYRYGVFGGVRALSNDGVYEAMLVTSDGALVPDTRKAWFTLPAWAPRDPFVEQPVPAPGAAGGGAGGSVLLDGRYAVAEVIRHAFPGGVYRATDQRTGATVIIKQARPHAGADLSGRDIRDWRRHEADMLSLFESSGVTARPLGLFEQQGEVFLVQEALSGVTLRQWASRHTALDEGAGWGPPPAEVRRIALALVDLVELAHAKGLVLRDFNPNNVMITENGDVRLIDLELLVRPGDRVSRTYTFGYAAPEQVAAPAIGPAPQLRADLYGLGATLFYLATGLDPLLAADEPVERPHRDRVATWLAALSTGNAAARPMAEVITALLHDDPARRPGPATVRAALTADDATDPVVPAGADSLRFTEPELKRALVDGLDHLLATMRVADKARLWPTGEFAANADPFSVQHGAAGVLGVLVRACQGDHDPRLRDAVATVADWIRRHLAREPRVLPGLQFGRSGTAWALLDAGTLLGDQRLVDLAVELARRVPVRWPNPDVCHGTAGAGLTQLRFWESTGDAAFLDRARQAADAVVQAAEHRDGLVRWTIPPTFASALAGVSHYGFAHGVAGVGAFLLGAGRATGDGGYLELATAAVRTLVRGMRQENGGAYWPGGLDGGGPVKTHWCSGSSGVGTFLARMWQHQGDDRLREVIAMAAVAVRRTRWHAGSAQCHGLAGDGDFLLDLAEVFGEERYRHWAAELATGIYARHTLRAGRMLPPDETGSAVVADFGTGLSGVLAFLLRLRDSGPRLWLPASFTGAGPGG